MKRGTLARRLREAEHEQMVLKYLSSGKRDLINGWKRTAFPVAHIEDPTLQKKLKDARADVASAIAVIAKIEKTLG
jgi:hypothetical protein